MTSSLQDTSSLIGRLLLALLFLPAGLMKIAGFAGTVGYIGSVGLPRTTIRVPCKGCRPGEGRDPWIAGQARNDRLGCNPGPDPGTQ